MTTFADATEAMENVLTAMIRGFGWRVGEFATVAEWTATLTDRELEELLRLHDLCEKVINPDNDMAGHAERELLNREHTAAG